MEKISFSEINKIFDDIFNSLDFVQYNFDSFSVFKDSLDQLPLNNNGLEIILNMEIKYFPNINKKYTDYSYFIEYFGKKDIIQDYNGFERVENISLDNLDILKYNPNIINVNNEGFVYLREPSFFMDNKKNLFLTSFTGSKMNKNDFYYSPILEGNDKLLMGLNKGDYLIIN